MSRKRFLFYLIIPFGVMTILLNPDNGIVGYKEVIVYSANLIRAITGEVKAYPIVTLEGRLNLLKEALVKLHANFTKLPKSKFPAGSGDYCGMYSEEGRLPRTFIPRVFSCDTPACKEGVTLMAQVSCDRKRLQMFSNVLLGWPGPVSLTIYINKGQENLLQDMQKVPAILLKPNLELHLAADNARVYPQNALRQLTLDQIRTEFTFHIDADFIPSKGLYEHLVSRTRKDWPKKRLLVIPAMEYLIEKPIYPLITKPELLQLWRKEQVQSFKQITHRAEHYFTNFAQWITTNNTYTIPQNHERFEPYVVFRTKEIPAYDQRFTGGLNDKISQILKMIADGFRLFIDGQHFVIHMQHTRKDDKSPLRPHFERCNAQIYINLVSELCKANPEAIKAIFWQEDIRKVDKRKLLPKDCPGPPRRIHHKRVTVSSIILK